MASPQAIEGLPGYRHLALGDTLSTNVEAMDFARGDDRGNLWVTAERQIQGKGRRGRPWVSERGNLYASLLLTDPAPILKVSTLPLVAALAVRDALHPFFADKPHAPAIKWPNDILIAGAKVSGILLESELMADGRLAVVIGCGINCKHHPDVDGYAATNLEECGILIEPQVLFKRLAVSFDKALSIWNRGQGFPAIRRLWLDAAEGLGNPVAVNLPDGRLDGIFEDIDEEGRLLLRQKNGVVQNVSAGDLFFRQ